MSDACGIKDTQLSDYEVALKMYQAEVDKPWPEMQEDISDLYKIIAQFDETVKALYDLGEDIENIKLPVLFRKGEDGYNIDMPKWLYEALAHFKAKYGDEFGDFMLEKTLSKVWHKMVPLQPIEFKSSSN